MVEGSPDACLSASEWTGIYYLSPLPIIKLVMSWFNSLGKAAYGSHVSIKVDYPGSWPRLRVRPTLQSSNNCTNMVQSNMSMLHKMRNMVCVVGGLGLPSHVWSV